METTFSHPLFPVLAAVVGVSVALESTWLVVTQWRTVRWLELACDLLIFLVGELIRLAVRGAFLVVYMSLSNLVPWRVPTNALTAVACFLLADLCLYAWHRALHVIPFGWALHSVHHTGQTFALPLAGRLPWPLRLVDDLITAPLVLLGFDTQLIYLCLAVSFSVQVLAHAAAIGPLGPLDLLLNTPANHRVHHHLDGVGQQRNFGAALIIWDRLFGTFVRGDGQPAPVGVRGFDGSTNPIAVQLHGLRQWWAAR